MRGPANSRRPESRESGLPGGLWLAAGATDSACALVASGDARERTLWVSKRLGRIVYTAPEKPAAVPEGWTVARSPYEGHWSVAKPLRGAAKEGEARAQLETAGLEVGRELPDRGEPAVGAAAIASIASGMIKGWDAFYRKASELIGGVE